MLLAVKWPSFFRCSRSRYLLGALEMIKV